MPPRNNVYKRDSIMFYFDGEKEKTMDKVNFCNKCQLERINNRAVASYVCINCGDYEFVFFQQLIIEICQVEEYVSILMKE